MLTQQNIRDKFTNFFIENSHEKIESSPLVPQNDPTLLFANAGMNQFKDYFTGKATPKNRKAVSIQKCVRAGGKHNDLENVGLTARHHTFFEMLGNFSFGDYFKEDAIRLAWKFLTKELKIPQGKLYITVHESDEEARMIWHKKEGIPLNQIFYMGDKDNFWEMGDTGPCGPCSEIFFDHGEKFSDGSDTSSCILNDEGRYIEIWNLVFMQYEKYKDENNNIQRRNLPRPCVDTGAGLERLTACIQNVYWNYDIDGFDSIKREIEKNSGKKYTDKKSTSSIRIVSDHIRAATMLITDGVIPSNEGRGYVLRRIIRRAVRHLNELGVLKASFYKLVPSVFESLGKEYPQNKANTPLAEKLLKLEEEKFRQTLKSGLELLNKEILKLKETKSLSGDFAFKLYDTYGFPLDLTQVILEERGIELNIEEFNSAMKKQRENSKSSSKFTVLEDNLKTFYDIKERFGETQFLGYFNLKSHSKLIAMEKHGESYALIFNKTPFYAEGGGQVGDTGEILSNDQKILATVTETQKPVEGLFVHYCSAIDHSQFKIGNEYYLSVNKDSRELIMRNHTATHLLQSALIEVLGSHIKQAGSRVSSDSLRFDFTHPESVSTDQLKKVENLVNQKISQALPVEATLMTKEQATKTGAMALFGEKYADTVRVLKIGDFSLELCGGTHVENTKDIASFTITVETSLASGVRRIEALSSIRSYEYLNERSDQLNLIERMFSARSKLLIEKLEHSQKELKSKTKEIQNLKNQIQANAAEGMFNDIEKFENGIGFVRVHLKNGEAKDFRPISDKFIEKNEKDILFLYKIHDEKISYLLRTNRNNTNINCSQVLKVSQPIIAGRGGGRPDMAQGSGSSAQYKQFLDQVISELKALQ